MEEKIRKFLEFIANPRLVLCFLIAWMITNGWCYIFLAVGGYFDIKWMLALGGAYATFLWGLPTPEKLITFPIAIALLRWLFPNDQKTLAVLKEMYRKAKAAFQAQVAKWKGRKSGSESPDPQATDPNESKEP